MDTDEKVNEMHDAGKTYKTIAEKLHISYRKVSSALHPEAEAAVEPFLEIPQLPEIVQWISGVGVETIGQRFGVTVEEVQRWINEDLTLKDIADRFGVTRAYVKDQGKSD